MHSQLDHLFIELENQRHQIQERVKLFPNAFNHKPKPDKWSVQEILAHIITAEKLSVQYILKKRQGIDQVGNTGIVEELKMVVLKLSQRLPLKFSAPKPVVNATPTYGSMDELVQDWNLTRENFKQLLEQVKDDQLKKKIYKHIIVGRLNVIHAVKFLREHVNHHLPQINRLLK